MTTRTRPDQPKNHDAFQLMQNGLSFLQKAKDELESDPKFSVVSFWTAVEILMKVPLVNHDWRLIVRKNKARECISREQFTAGDFSSINFIQTCDLLRTELNIFIDDVTLDYFKRVQQHRNRVVHFFHGAESEPDLDELRNEQSDAWFALTRLITDEWSKAFSTDQWVDVNVLSRAMLTSSTYYASAKYRSIKNELDQLNCELHQCPVCSQRAYLKTREDAVPVVYEDCKVCNQTEHYLVITCPECELEDKLDEGDAPFCCSHCEHTEPRYDMVDEDDSSPEDYQLGSLPAGCSDCEGYDTVCQYSSGYLCTQCLKYSETLGCCEYCHYASTSVTEFSGMCGCNFCPGHPETWDLYDD